MCRQLQFLLSIENLYPVLGRRSGTGVEKDNRAIAELMREFNLTEEEATELHFSRMDTDSEVDCTAGVHRRPPAGPSQWRNNATRMWHYHCADCGKTLTSPDPPEKGS